MVCKWININIFQSEHLHIDLDIYQHSNICQSAKLSQDVYIYQNIHLLSKYKYVDTYLYLFGSYLCVKIWLKCDVPPDPGPVSLRLMTSQFKDIVTHTQK